ncbi:HNH endonuclease [Candidatus Pacearchaeota archaeon]|nr:HNH endonuclease [Candidatus Pacearchaeota archaeon]
MIYFIKDKNNKRGHPTKKGQMITRKLKNGTAKIISRTKDSLTVKLLDIEFKDEDTVDAEFRVGIDPGANHIGFALYKIYKQNITLLISGEADIRSNNITKNLVNRKMYRRKRRNNRRKNVLRKYGKAKFRKPVWKNRKRKHFQPTFKHLINTHINVIKYFLNKCPINKVHIEYAKFDTQKMINYNIKSIWYQRGQQFMFENTKAYIRSRDNYTCQICNKKCLDYNEVHHIVWRRHGGSDKPDNLILLCESCHKKVHKNLVKCLSIKNKTLKQASLLNSCMKYIFMIFEKSVPTQDTLGSITKIVRLNSGIEKTHENDAKIIALCDSLELQDIKNYKYSDLDNHVTVKQYRRHDRALVNQLEDRKYYLKDDLSSRPKIVAWNRNKSSVQTKDSLTDLRKKQKNIQVITKSGGPIYRRGNINRRFIPGQLINYNGEIDICRGWASTQCKVILENNGYVKQKLCKVVRNNSGLVFV